MTEKDGRFFLTEGLLLSEREYEVSLRGVGDTYATPLNKLSSLSHEDHHTLFTGISTLTQVSHQLVLDIEELLKNWDGENSLVGALFSKAFWNSYEDYLDFYTRSKELLRHKEEVDEEFAEFCKLRRGAAKHSLHSLLELPVQRLAGYEKFLQDVLKETRHDHSDADFLAGNAAQAKTLVRRTEGPETDLDRIQDLFPNDNLRLHEKDPTKMKGLMRKRSASTAARLQRALSAKALRSPSSERLPVDAPEPQPKRQFIMESAVHFTTGLQSQDRHLFLFTDLLLVAKARSGGNFKLKDKVRVCEMWMSSCVDEVSEVTKSIDTSFVIGWPTTNVVATFNAAATKDLWYNKLHQAIGAEREKEPRSTTIRISYYDHSSQIEYCKTLSVNPTQTARDCIRSALEHLEMAGREPSNFQLWVRSSPDESPYPLIGHEFPFAIQRHALREAETDELDLPAPHGFYCQFILRNDRKCSLNTVDSKKLKKPKKSPMKIQKVFRRSGSRTDLPDGDVQGARLLFGQPLSKICPTDQHLPKPIMCLLTQLFLYGPWTVGIFRKSANARQVRELRNQLDNDTELELEGISPIVLSALFKEFLRSLPDCLLGCVLYDRWLEVGRIDSGMERVAIIQSLLSQLPKQNVALMQHFLCVLYHISANAAHNKMSASNLSVCTTPSLIWATNKASSLGPEAQQLLPSVIEFLVERCGEIFGAETLRLMGDPPSRDPYRHDSGAEESDSLHSIGQGVLRRDDSSIDSLERELMADTEPTLPRTDKMATINLSRDSGLTMSDCQLYTPDDEESESTSSSGHGSSAGFESGPYHYPAPDNPHALYTSVYKQRGYCAPRSSPLEKQREYSSGHNKLTQSYSTPVGANDIYSTPQAYNNRVQQQQDADGTPNPYFQRNDRLRQRSNIRKPPRLPANEGGEGDSPMMRRSASEESLLNPYPSPNSCHTAKKPAHHRKGKAPLPPVETKSETCVAPSSPMTRSKSVHLISSLENSKMEPGEEDSMGDWQMSRSTPHIDEVDKSYDSSTLSDDDSTPHVSRSNSRGKDCDYNAINMCWESVYGVVSPKKHADTIIRTSGNINRTASQSTVKSTDSSSTLTNSSTGGNPPSYEETMCRRSLFKASPSPRLNDQGRLNSKARQLYEESLRIYNEQSSDEFVHASPARIDDSDPPPLPPKSDPPPLPPKQRLKKSNTKRFSMDSSMMLAHASLINNMYCNNDTPPDLPPKERYVQGESEPVYAQVPQQPGRKSSRGISTHPVERTSVETQTDDYRTKPEVQTVGQCTTEDMKDEEIQTSGNWHYTRTQTKYITSVEIRTHSSGERTPCGPSERRGRARRKDTCISSRSKSLPPTEIRSVESSDVDSSETDELSQTWSQAQSEDVDPVLRKEISWSVSQLRSLFSDKGVGDRRKEKDRAPITMFHLGGSRYSSPKTNYGEESYV